MHKVKYFRKWTFFCDDKIRVSFFNSFEFCNFFLSRGEGDINLLCGIKICKLLDQLNATLIYKKKSFKLLHKSISIPRTYIIAQKKLLLRVINDSIVNLWHFIIVIIAYLLQYYTNYKKNVARLRRSVNASAL